MIKSRNKILDIIRKLRSQYIDIFIDNSYEISRRIHFVMNEKGMDQKAFATLLKKKESEISKWMTGSHNFTLKTLAKVEEALDEKIIEVVTNEKGLNPNVTHSIILNIPYKYKSKNPSLSPSKLRVFESNYREVSYYPEC